ncbi:MAG: hypothetical protein AB1758_36895 [Candidatus Eremiobacterota bacterium]
MSQYNNGIVPTPAGKVVAPWIEDRGRHQFQRIQAGKADGSLDSQEVSALRGQYAEAYADLTAAKADDGRVGPRERMAVHRDLNDISRSIYAYRHD